jgi:hypothetical protein
MVAVLFAGCAHQTWNWESPNLNPQKFAGDRYECLRQTQQGYAVADRTGEYASYNSGVATNMPLFNACMQARGYVLVADKPKGAYSGVAPRQDRQLERGKLVAPWGDDRFEPKALSNSKDFTRTAMMMQPFFGS